MEACTNDDDAPSKLQEALKDPNLSAIQKLLLDNFEDIPKNKCEWLQELAKD